MKEDTPMKPFRNGVLTRLGDSRIPSDSTSYMVNVRIVKQVKLNDPLIAEESHVLMPRNPRKPSRLTV